MCEIKVVSLWLFFQSDYFYSDLYNFQMIDLQKRTMKCTSFFAVAGVLLVSAAATAQAQRRPKPMSNYPTTNNATYTVGEKGASLERYDQTDDELIDLSQSLYLGGKMKVLHEIQEGALYDCAKVKTIKIGTSNSRFNLNALQFRSSLLESFDVNPASTTYKSIEGVLYTSKEGVPFKLHRFPPAKKGEYRMAENITSIDYTAFHNCEEITSLFITSKVKYIREERAFSDCKKLVSFSVDEGNPKFFAKEGVLYEKLYKHNSDANAPKVLDKIILHAFPPAKSGTYVLPKEVVELKSNFATRGGASFANIERIEVEQGNQHFRSIDGVLYSLDGETLVAFPGGRSGSYTVPDGVKKIARDAFINSTRITELHLPVSFEKFDVTWEEYRKLEASFIFKGCSNLTKVEVDEKNPYFKSVDGVLYSKDEKTLVLCPQGKQGVFVVPDGVECVDYYAFFDCDKLTDIRLPWSLTNVRRSAFAECDGLTTLSTPYNVTEMEGFSEYPRPLKMESIYNFSTKSNFKNSNFRRKGNLLCTWWIADYFYATRTGDLAQDGYRTLERTKITAPTQRLVDGDNYDKPMREYYVTLPYTRNFTNTHWQPLYLPCDVRMEDLVSHCEVAELVGGDDKGIDAKRLKDMDVVKRYTPYVIRAKQTGMHTFTLKNVMLDVAAPTISTIKVGTYDYEIVGTFEKTTQLNQAGIYVMKAGRLRPVGSATAELPALRWYLKAPQEANVQALTLRVDGATPTALNTLSLEEIEKGQEVFSLDGRRLQTPVQDLSSGIYIVNGQKVAK